MVIILNNKRQIKTAQPDPHGIILEVQKPLKVPEKIKIFQWTSLLWPLESPSVSSMSIYSVSLWCIKTLDVFPREQNSCESTVYLTLYACTCGTSHNNRRCLQASKAIDQKKLPLVPCNSQSQGCSMLWRSKVCTFSLISGTRPCVMHQHMVISRGLRALKCQKLFMSADLCTNSGKLDITWGIHFMFFFFF